MEQGTAADWLGGRPLPDQQYFEDHLDGLLALRRAHREGRLADSRLDRALRGSYLSIRAAYLNEELVRDHITALTAT
jgi:hypothetical protein